MELVITAGIVESDGEDIYYELVSSGANDERDVVVLSHGAGGSHAVWYQQIPALGASFRIVTWDSRGFGNSTNRNDAPSADVAAVDLAAVLDHLAIDTVHLVGQSMGGWHNAAFALANPTRVLSLVFGDTIGGLWTDALRAAFEEFTKGPGLASPGPQVVGGHRALWPGTKERDHAHAFLYQALGSFHTPPMDKLGATIGWTVTHDEIAAIGAPVLFVAGVYDEIFPADLLAESCRMLPDAQYVEIAAAGHSPYFEQPEAWNEAVAAFLREAAAGH